MTIKKNSFAVTLQGSLVGKRFFDENPFWCQFSGAMCIIACGTSLVSMAFLAINRCLIVPLFLFIVQSLIESYLRSRYVCIIHPSSYKKMFTMKKTFFYCCLTWLTGVVFNFPNFVPGWAQYDFDAKVLTCSSNRTKKIYAMIFTSVGIILPCFAMAVCYLRIFFYSYSIKTRLETKPNKPKSKLEALRLAKSLFASFALFVLCW